MNTKLVTTGLWPLTVGSVELFEQQAVANGLPWDLTGGTVTLILSDPEGNETSHAATISGGVAFVTWTVTGPEGNWTRAWRNVVSGVTQISRPIVFSVVESP